MADDRATGVTWVVGVGANAGLGAAVARRHASAGQVVAVTGRTPQRLEAVVEAIRAAGGRAVALPGDIGQPEEAARLGAAVGALGPLRAAVFNAGNAVRGSVLELEPAQFEQAWRGSVWAAFLFAREVVPLLLGHGAAPVDPHGLGSLVFSGATASLRGGAKFAAFAAAKAGLRSLAQSLAREHGPQGVHVAHVVVDGGIDGERLRSSAPHRVADAGPDGLLDPEAIAETYWQLHRQHRSAWTLELDLRPYREPF